MREIVKRETSAQPGGRPFGGALGRPQEAVQGRVVSGAARRRVGGAALAVLQRRERAGRGGRRWGGAHDPS